jgi:S-adenosylmethionine:tRNA ribosyltransferase-isomerase
LQEKLSSSRHPRDLYIKDFSYVLPEDRIAQFPLPGRDFSKLLIYRNSSIKEDTYHHIADHLPENALLVFNNTRVVAARILFQKPTGGVIEIFALEPHEQYADVTTAMQTKTQVWWKCLIGGAGKWKYGQVLQKQVSDNGVTISLQARIAERSAGSFTIAFFWEPASLTFSEILHYFGIIPIPPYLKRDTEKDDHERYQTIYAAAHGSVAAPTAGLHFTENIFLSLQKKNIESHFITLHVGAGTFMPVKSETVNDHQMHPEYLEVQARFIRRLIDHPDDIFAVGTTSLRTLESLYWMGLKCYLDPAISKDQLEMKQWEIYDELQQKDIPVKTALTALLGWMATNKTEVLVIRTSILIAPPYLPKIVRGLVTNFHQPNSTLLLLVAALIGDNWTKVYDYALEHQFRFLSYGDGCLLYL